MYLSFLLPILFIHFSWCEVGKVSKIYGGSSAYLVRSADKISLQANLELKQGDEIHSEDSVLNLVLNPAGQYRLSKHSVIKITQNIIQDLNDTEKSKSIIEFMKGVIRAQVIQDKQLEIDHKIQAKDIAFAIRGTEFEVSQTGDDFDLNVVEGSVEVSSPHIQTFVPEIVKANEGFRFNRKERAFRRRPFKLKDPENPRFLAREEMKKLRRERRLLRRQIREKAQVGLSPERIQQRAQNQSSKKGLRREERRHQRLLRRREKNGKR